MSVTKEELQAGMRVVFAVAETIRESGNCPAGTVYAALMSRGVSLQGFESIIRTLSNAGLVRQSGDMLHWIGGAR